MRRLFQRVSFVDDTLEHGSRVLFWWELDDLCTHVSIRCRLLLSSFECETDHSASYLCGLRRRHIAVRENIDKHRSHQFRQVRTQFGGRNGGDRGDFVQAVVPVALQHQTLCATRVRVGVGWREMARAIKRV